MIMAGYEYVGEMPFKNVYFTGIVRDSLGRKMSKSLGNSPDPLELIERYGADGVRMGMMLAAPAGHDIMFDEKLCEQGRNFCNKIWNAFRLVKGLEVSDSIAQPEVCKVADRWFAAKLNETVAEVEDLFGKFRISEALMAVYKLMRDEFSSWYLEMIKPAYGQPIDAVSHAHALAYFDALLRLMHPFMPFITEELWQSVADRADGESIMYAPMPAAGECDIEMLAAMETAKAIVTGVRGVRASKNIPPKTSVTLNVVGSAVDTRIAPVIIKLANVDAINDGAHDDPAAARFMVDKLQFNVPLANTIDVEAEKARLAKDLEYQRGFLASVEKKLGNERFVNNAPAQVVDAERRKQQDALHKIATLTAALDALTK